MARAFILPPLTTNPARRAAHCVRPFPPCGRRAQRKFLDLGGSAENQGDLRSVVLHKMTLGAQKSTFPIALGVRMTGVDDKAFAKTGESYSMITMPNADSHQSRVLQEDNTELVKPLTNSNINTPQTPRMLTEPGHLLCRPTSLRASSPATPLRVNAALEPHRHTAYALTHSLFAHRP